ncbi:MAG: hypothetical protein N3E45_14335 [Oscillatoriaceae bacterium SKW80]|nr:hypothetical protein [Oscillatoriaceae bacterium SKYG93]MCX8121977.1 hypothetical protein [Oscillatoriaceae bacterium SKW80]MDW8454263.1 hypothetical protein [Oscillatoriaceae cyanobacterium SKYGB_i_bin93]
MERSKIVAIVTGAISIILAIAYLLIVQLLDFRGEMLPAPQSLVVPEMQPVCCWDKTGLPEGERTCRTGTATVTEII